MRILTIDHKSAPFRLQIVRVSWTQSGNGPLCSCWCVLPVTLVGGSRHKEVGFVASSDGEYYHHIYILEAIVVSKIPKA